MTATGELQDASENSESIQLSAGGLVSLALSGCSPSRLVQPNSPPWFADLT